MVAAARVGAQPVPRPRLHVARGEAGRGLLVRGRVVAGPSAPPSKPAAAASAAPVKTAAVVEAASSVTSIEASSVVIEPTSHVTAVVVQATSAEPSSPPSAPIKPTPPPVHSSPPPEASWTHSTLELFTLISVIITVSANILSLKLISQSINLDSPE